MLSSISVSQFYEWMAFAELEPFEEARQDLRIEKLMAVLTTAITGRKQDPKLFRFGFGDMPHPEEQPTPQAPWQTLKMVAKMFVAASRRKKARP